VTNERIKSIFVRVTPQEKIRIDRSAKGCGLTMSEYLRKRALGFEPKPIPPDSIYDFNSKLDDLYAVFENRISGKTEEKLLSLIHDIQNNFILPSKDAGVILNKKEDG